MKIILEVIIFLSLFLIVLILGRKLPKLDDSFFLDYKKKKLVYKDSWFLSLLNTLDKKFLLLFEFFLRKTKIWLLKLDNEITRKLAGFKKEDADKKMDFKEIFSENQEDSEAINGDEKI